MSRARMDLAGAVACTSFSALLAFNQVVVKITNAGFSPVFAAGLRSALALAVVLVWMALRRRRFAAPGRALPEREAGKREQGRRQ